MADNFGGNTGLFDSKAFSDAVSKGALDQIKNDAPSPQSDSLDASSLLNSALKGGIEITKQVVSAFLPPASTTPAAASVPAAGGNAGGAAGGGGGGSAAPAPAPAQPGTTQQPAAPQEPPANPPPVAMQPPAKSWTTGQKVGVSVAVGSAVIGLGLVLSARRKESNANR